MHFRLDAWRSDQAFPTRADEDDAPAPQVVSDVEAPPHEWAPVRPAPGTTPFDEVRFVDGVQASDAVIWIDDPTADGPQPGLVASWGAGVVRSRPDGCELEELRVERGIFSDATTLGPVVVPPLVWRPQVRQPADDEVLANRLHAARRRLEHDVGRLADDGSLVVYDGVLHPRFSAPTRNPAGHISAPTRNPAGHTSAVAAVGLAKRAHRTYLPPVAQRIVGQLRAGERTPVFCIDPVRRRFSFYLALADPRPAGVADPASGTARIELQLAADDDTTAALRLADRVTATLPRFASEPHADPRAPQNLAPIRSLERELRRMLGMPDILRAVLAEVAAGA